MLNLTFAFYYSKQADVLNQAHLMEIDQCNSVLLDAIMRESDETE